MPSLPPGQTSTRTMVTLARTGIRAWLEKTRSPRRKLFNMLLSFLCILPWALLVAMPALDAALWVAGIGH